MKLLKSLRSSMDSTKLFAGMMMIMLNIGSKYVVIKLSKNQETYMKNYVGREILIFAICWMGTRDIITSIGLTAAFFILSEHVFNENSKFCVLPKKYKELQSVIDTNNDGVISEKEIEEAVAILTKAKTQKSEKDKNAVYKHFSSKKQ